MAEGFPQVEPLTELTILQCMQHLDGLLRLPPGSHRMTISTAGGYVAVHDQFGLRTTSARRPSREIGLYHNHQMPPLMRVEYSQGYEDPRLVIGGGANRQVINNWLALLMEDVKNTVSGYVA